MLISFIGLLNIVLELNPPIGNFRFLIYYEVDELEKAIAYIINFLSARMGVLNINETSLLKYFWTY